MSNDYEVYRFTTLGNMLQETLDELIQVSNKLNFIIDFTNFLDLFFSQINCKKV